MCALITPATQASVRSQQRRTPRAGHAASSKICSRLAASRCVLPPWVDAGWCALGRARGKQAPPPAMQQARPPAPSVPWTRSAPSTPRRLPGAVSQGQDQPRQVLAATLLALTALASQPSPAAAAEFAQPEAIATEASSAASSSGGPVPVYFGNGCFWGRQKDFVDTEMAMGRSVDDLSAVVGYAGGARTGPDGKVCTRHPVASGKAAPRCTGTIKRNSIACPQCRNLLLVLCLWAAVRAPAPARCPPPAPLPPPHLQNPCVPACSCVQVCYYYSDPRTIYERLGHAEVVQLQLPSADDDNAFKMFADTYFKWVWDGDTSFHPHDWQPPRCVTAGPISWQGVSTARLCWCPCRQFRRLPDGRMQRSDPQDAGPGYRNVVGLPGGADSPLFKVRAGGRQQHTVWN